VQENGRSLPTGVQFIGRAFDEATLYRVAYAFEQATEYRRQRPTLASDPI
jgi:aspartyl-tRNA(Asn)/glutamyl-tRNA(Gln) amidotransferase subunit A